MSKSNTVYIAYVSYPAELYFSDDNLDKQIEMAAGIYPDGSGMGFGLRDLDFVFDTETEMLNAVENIKNVHENITVNTSEYNEDE